MSGTPSEDLRGPDQGADAPRSPGAHCPSVLVIGGGLAGLSAAAALASRGLAVRLVESRGRLGGRAGSFTDPVTGRLIDACQHVSMGCCTNLAHFFRTVGVGHLVRPERCLYFMTPDGRVSRLWADRLPPPLHLARAFWSAHYLSAREKLKIARALAALRWTSAEDDPPFSEWLGRHGQTQTLVRRFWGVVLTSALNEAPERVGLRYARKVFVDAFLRHRRGFELELPTVPLGRLYGEEMAAWFSARGVELRLNAGVRRLVLENGRVRHAELRTGEPLRADWYIAAVPFDRLLDLLPTEVVDGAPYFGDLRRLETSPITSLHLWFDRPVLPLPHVVLVDCVGQWAFDRGRTAAGEHYVQVVVSAARQFRGLGGEEVRRGIVEELARLFRPACAARLLRSRVVTEHHATFSAVPGVDRWRPPQRSPLANLVVAGDWTATGWPATMEGAVRSGYLAAEAILAGRGSPQRVIRPDL